LAISISLAFLVLWSWFFSPQPQQRITTPETSTPETTSQAPQHQTIPESQPAPTPIAPTGDPDQTIAGQAPAESLPGNDLPAMPGDKGERITVQSPLYEAVFNSEGGVLERFELLQYRQTIQPDAPFIDLIGSPEPGKRPMGLLWNNQPTWMQGQWTVKGQNIRLRAGESQTLTFVGRFGELELVREFLFSGDSYLVQEKTLVRNHSPHQISASVGFTLASEALSSIQNRYAPTQFMYYDATGLEQEKSEKKLLAGVQADTGIRWGAIQSNYFLAAIIPSFDNPIFKAKLDGSVHRAVMQTQPFLLAPRLELPVETTYYLGPREKNALEAAPDDLVQALHYGWFDIIAKPLIYVLNFFYEYVHNYGIAIILLTICIKLIFWPLSQKSYKSMQQMKKLQPMMVKLREKHKDDRQKMNEEMMQLYKTYKVNPLGGCLPIAVQIPVFISLYQALMGAIELRHAPFITHVPFTDIVWLADLSAKDPYYVTPIIMGATMFLQQKLTPAPGDPMQAKIMLFLPIIFTFLFLSFPSGLVLYWLVNNVLSIAQQWWVMRKVS